MVKKLFSSKPWIKTLLAFLVSFLIPWVFLLMMGQREPEYDAWVYTQLSECFQREGLFNFAAYAAENGGAYRGYLLPWIIALGKGLSGLIPFMDYRFLVSLFAAAVCTLALPAVMAGVFRVKVPAWRRPLVSALLTLLYQGALMYALSDLWAVGFGLMALAALMRMMDENALPLWRRLLYGAGCGAALAAAYNIRTIYLLLWLTLGLAAVVLVLCRRKIALRARLLCLPALLFGLALCSAPQMYSNAVTYNSASPLIMGEQGSSLFVNQLYNGIYVQKYESNIGGGYWEEGLNYVDDAGMLVLYEEDMPTTFAFEDGAEHLSGIGDYVALALRHPLDFIGIYARHFVNMMDMRYPELFVDEVTPNPLYPTVNYLTMYLALAAFVLHLRGMKRSEMGGLWLLGAFLLPTFAIAAGAVESRFGIGLHLLLWGCLMALPSAGMLHRIRGREWVLLGVGLVAFLCVMTGMGGQTLAGFEDLPLLYQ